MEDTKKEVDAEKTVDNKKDKVLVRIPVDEINKDNAFVTVTINGNATQIKRGEDVYVTSQIRQILLEAKYI
jgi:hypothetical protein